MAATNLLSLPTELLTEICTLLCLHCTESRDGLCNDLTSEGSVRLGVEHADLLNVCRTSRRLREVAKPFVYHWMLAKGNGGRFLDFLTGLGQHPSIAAQVRQLAVPNLGYLRLGDQPVVDALVAYLGIRVHDEYGSPQETALFGYFDEEQAEIHDCLLLEILLRLVPNLERLSLQLSDHVDWNWLPPGELSTLRFLHLMPNARSRPIHLRDLAPLLDKMPHLESLEATSYDERHIANNEFGLCLTNLKALTLTTTFVTYGLAEKLMDIFPRLQTLCFKYGQESSSTITPTPLSTTQNIQSAQSAMQNIETQQNIMHSMQTQHNLMQSMQEQYSLMQTQQSMMLSMQAQHSLMQSMQTQQSMMESMMVNMLHNMQNTFEEWVNLHLNDGTGRTIAMERPLGPEPLHAGSRDSLPGFGFLERLVIDERCVQLRPTHGQIGPKSLSNLLFPSVVYFELNLAYPGFPIEDFLRLGQGAKEGRFPNLKLFKVRHHEAWPLGLELVAAFRGAGVQFSVEQTKRGQKREQ